VVSFVIHLAIVLLIIFVRSQGILSWDEVTDMGDPSQKKGGGGGGGSLRVVALPALPRPAAAQVAVKVPPPPPVVPVPEPVVVVPPPPPTPEAVVEAIAPPDSTPTPSAGQGGTGTGGGKGTGTGTGTGAGTGPGSGSGSGPGTGGAGGRGYPPEPRQVILPPLDYPKSLRGKTIAVTFWVGTDGRVERVATAPEIGDGGFAKKFDDVMKNYRFRPARSPEGTIIAGTTTVSITF
jgi:outer membrane biosynthesis protein TonB